MSLSDIPCMLTMTRIVIVLGFMDTSFGDGGIGLEVFKN